jgi:hypothetical protein
MLPDTRSRPGDETGAAGDRRAPTEPILRLQATILVDLTLDESDTVDIDRADRFALDVLSTAPAGAHVRVDVSGRRWLTHSAVTWLHEAAQRLELELLAEDPAIVRRWHRAITAGTVE